MFGLSLWLGEFVAVSNDLCTVFHLFNYVSISCIPGYIQWHIREQYECIYFCCVAKYFSEKLLLCMNGHVCQGMTNKSVSYVLKAR